MKKLIAAVLATTALTSAAFAGGHGISEFRIGILGGENAQDRLNNNECLRARTENLLGIDMAWLGASGYAKTFLSDENAVQPVLVAVNLDGSYGYHSIGFARKDSNITSLEDMQGKAFGFGDPNSTSGYLIPSIEIPELTGASMESGDYFGEVKFTGGHEQTIVAVFNGDIDAGVTWADGLGNWEDGYNSGALRKAVDAGLIDMNELVQIWKSKPIPEGPIVLRQALPEDVKIKMTGLMASLKDMDADCAYNVFAGEKLGLMPITHDAYVSIVGARQAKSN
ncbi:MAG: phosphate/phosphite/phosphonate ABC transporter substrate-binding protein [Rhodobacteraceae bacterium]|nr:phosphate/phosphite/phosphonate ABC transporter substrate-binding protein [Paracoccaceae bacterium]